MSKKTVPILLAVMFFAACSSGTWDYYDVSGELKFWQTTSPMKLLHTVETKNEEVTAVTFTKDGQLIISTALDGIVR
ncbi:MAG: hypothetical protein IAF02_25605, partial [Anaerolineae bacterium]|nr:hypothetical protein [Anaerolineae bacterium]